MGFRTALSDRLGLTCPVIQAPMAGGPTTPALVAAVSRAGGLGMLAHGYTSPARMREEIRQVRALTERPFGVNLLLWDPPAEAPAAVAAALAALAPYHAALGLPPPTVPQALAETLEAQLAVLLEERVPVFSWAFGVPDAGVLAAFRARGTLLVGTATHVAEGRALAVAGVDVVVAQGAEAGGHRGTFLGPPEAALIGTMALVPQLVDALAVPVVAAGGIMDGRGLVAALALGASGVQMGTAFLVCDEAGTSPPYRRALAASPETATRVTRVFSGKAVRAIENRLARELRPLEGQLPGYPLMNALTRGLRAAATAQDQPELMGMWAGQASPLARTGPAADLMAAWLDEAEAVLARLERQSRNPM